MKKNQYRLSTDLRLKTAQQFKETFKKGKYLKSKYFTLVCVDNNLCHPRIGFAITKAKVRKAVMRNTIKRIVRESLRLQQDKIKMLDIVLLATKKTSSASKKELANALNNVWETQLNREKVIDSIR